MSLLLLFQSSTTLQLTGRSRTVERVLLTAALTFAVAITGTSREIERVREATLTSKTSLQGTSREVERLLGATLVTADVVAAVVVRQDSSGGRIKKPRMKREFLIQDSLYEDRIKVNTEKPDSIHPALKPAQIESVIAGSMVDLIPQNSLIVSEEDLELVLAALHYLDDA